MKSMILSLVMLVSCMTANAFVSAYDSAQKQIPLEVAGQGVLVKVEAPLEPVKVVVDVSNDSVPGVIQWYNDNALIVKQKYLHDLRPLGTAVVFVARSVCEAGYPLSVDFISSTTQETFSLAFSNEEIASSLSALEKEDGAFWDEMMKHAKTGIRIPTDIAEIGVLTGIVKPTSPLKIVFDTTQTFSKSETAYLSENLPEFKEKIISDMRSMGDPVFSLATAAFHIGVPVQIDYISGQTTQTISLTFSLRDLARAIFNNPSK